MNNPAGRRKNFSTFLDVSENDPAGGGKNLAIFEIFQVYFHFLKYVQTFEHPKIFSRLPARDDPRPRPRCQPGNSLKNP